MAVGQSERHQPDQVEEPSRSVLWVAVIWGRVLVGLALAGAGGAAFGHAWTNESAPWWGIGATTLMVGILLVLSTVYARSRLPNTVPRVAVPEEPVQSQEPLLPLLGALLVYKYRLVSQAQLQEALAEQQKTKPRRRLGEILVLKGMITVSQLEKALEFQRSYLDERPAP